jgi:hypothetical protein
MTVLPPALVSLAPELVLSFRRLLQATRRGATLRRWEDSFALALDAADTEALDVIHAYLNRLYGEGRNEPVQGLVNGVEAEIALFWAQAEVGA